MLDNENADVTKIAVPIKIIQGEWDYICPSATVQKWFNELQAPQKEFVIINGAAHMVNFKDPKVGTKKWKILF